MRTFSRSEWPLQKNFFQIKVEEDLKFLLAQITLKYSKLWRETAATPQVFTQWARVDHPPHVQHVLQIDVPSWKPYQHSAMFPVQFTYELNIPIGCWLVLYLLQTRHSVCFLFSIQFLISELNLPKDSGRKDSGPAGLMVMLLKNVKIVQNIIFFILQPLQFFIVEQKDHFNFEEISRGSEGRFSKIIPPQLPNTLYAGWSIRTRFGNLYSISRPVSIAWTQRIQQRGHCFSIDVY